MIHTGFKRSLSGLLPVVMVFAAAQLACSATGGNAAKTAQPAQGNPTAAQGGGQSTLAKATQGQAAQPTATKQQAVGGGGGGFACFGSAWNGAACLTDAGWQPFVSDSSDTSSQEFADMAACPDGKIYAATGVGLEVFDGTGWQNITIDGEYNAYFVACGKDGSIWANYYHGTGQYKDGAWNKFAYTLYDTGEVAGLVVGMDVAPDGKVWVANSNSVSSYDGKAWKEYKQGSGFDDKYYFEKLTVDSKGQVWVSDGRYLFQFTGDDWKKVDLENIVVVESLAVDPQGRVWVASKEEGIQIYDGSKWSDLTYTNGDIHSNDVYFAAFDGAGRTWLGLGYGIDIQDNNAWTNYQMGNADLPDNEITSLAVVGKGPALPAPMAKKAGSIVGSITKEGKPFANAAMEFCVETIVFSYTGKTPCSTQPFMKATQTGADGKFSAADLPPGYYVLTLQMEDGGWATMGFGGSGDRVLVQEGQETDVGELQVKTS